MGFWKKMGKMAGGKLSEEELEQKRKEKEEWEANRKLWKKKDDLLKKFEMKYLKKICTEIEGEDEPKHYVRDEDGQIIYDKQDYCIHKRCKLAKDYREHICDPDNFDLLQIQDFAIKYSIVPFNYFSEVIETDSKKREFDDIVDKIKLYFDPEKITNEEHLEAQLAVFLKATFHDKKIKRQEGIKSNDQLDIVVDDTFVFELKVPKNRTDLRNLIAQLEEYVEEYPYICVIIADISGTSDTNERTINVSDDIESYKIKYKEKFDIDTLVYKTGIRKR
jgi:hypothetical protein